MKLREIMRSSPTTVGAHETIGEAARRMLRGGIRHLPVVEDGRVVGLLDARDILRFHGEGGLESLVSSAMSTPVQTASPDDDIAEVAGRLGARKPGFLPVVELGRLVGVVTTTDVLATVVNMGIPATPEEPRVGALMTRNPATAHPDDYLLDAVGRMSNLGVRHLPVIDGDGRLVGMLSDRDVRVLIGDFLVTEGEEGLSVKLRVERVGDVASRAPMTIDENARIDQALAPFVDFRVGALPVVTGENRLVGILSYVDLLRFFEHTLRRGGVPPRAPVVDEPSARH